MFVCIEDIDIYPVKMKMIFSNFATNYGEKDVRSGRNHLTVLGLKTRNTQCVCLVALLTVLCCFSFTFVNTAFAASKWQNLKELQKTVYDFVAKNIEGPNSNYNITLNPVDSRLKLIHCEQAMEAFWPTTNQMSD